ncbi:MAG: PfkB family carbohydrate kinase [Pseudomonadota bacterium]
MNQSVVCAGRLYTDLVFTGLGALPQLGTETFAEGLTIHPGGGAFITAAHLVSLGRPTALLAFLPPAPFDAALSAQLAQAGVDLDLCRAAAPGVDPQLTVAMSHGADRAFLTRRSGAAVPDLPNALQGFAHLHIGELTTLLEAPDLVPAARTAGMTISLDCGWDAEALARTDLAPLLADIDVLLPNEAEAEALSGNGLPLPCASLTVIKRGAEGSEAVTASHRHQSAAKPVDVVDTTGAGDAFNAGFLDAWLAGRTLTACLEAGNAQGALAVSATGGASMLAPVARTSKLAAL